MVEPACDWTHHTFFVSSCEGVGRVNSQDGIGEPLGAGMRIFQRQELAPLMFGKFLHRCNDATLLVSSVCHSIQRALRQNQIAPLKSSGGEGSKTIVVGGVSDGESV